MDDDKVGDESTLQLKVIDLSKPREELTKEILNAMENEGFLVLENVPGFD